MRTRIFLGVLFACFITASAALAQNSTKAFTLQDGTFTFIYPAEWTVTPSGNEDLAPRITLGNLPDDQVQKSPDGVQAIILLPQKRAYYGLIGSGSTPADIARSSVKTAQAMPAFTFGTPPADGTPELLDLQPATVPITEFTVNGHPAARVVDQKIMLGLDSGFMVIVLDLGGDDLVSLIVNSVKGGIDTVKKYEPVIVAVAETIRYKPKVVYSGNPDLPQVYSGVIGVWRRGTGRFFYPANWIVISFATQIIQNTPDYIDTKAPKAGQLIAVLQGPSELRATTNPLDPSALFDQCGTQAAGLTARSLAEKLTTLNSAQAQQLKDNGITLTPPETTTANGKELVYYSQTQGDIENLVILIDLGKGTIPAISAFTKRGEMKQFEKQLLAIAATLEYTQQPCVHGIVPIMPTPAQAR